MVHEIINSEVGRAVRKYPTWAKYAQDLYQDAWVAVLRNPAINPATMARVDQGAYIRTSARCAIITGALGYLGVPNPSHHVTKTSRPAPVFAEGYDINWMPANDDRVSQYLDADELEHMKQRKEGRLRSLAVKIAKHNPRAKAVTHRMETLEMYYRYQTSGERMEDIAKAYGISKQAVSLRLAVAARDLEAA